MEIEYYEKDVYGQTLNYVKDEAIAGNLARLLSRKTVSSTDMTLITDIFGATWKQVLPPKPNK